METFSQSDQPALAQRLGDTVHISPLLLRLERVSGCTKDRLGQWLLKCAVGRGASHYARSFTDELPPDFAELTHEELGVGLCLGQHPYNPTNIRAAAQLLSSPATDAPRLARLAVLEGVEPVLRYIAEASARFDPEAQPWMYLLGHLPNRLVCPPDALPHWSRFVSQTGVTPFGGGPDIQWLRRRELVG